MFMIFATLKSTHKLQITVAPDGFLKRLADYMQEEQGGNK
jgi:hypothetical protein